MNGWQWVVHTAWPTLYKTVRGLIEPSTLREKKGKIENGNGGKTKWMRRKQSTNEGVRKKKNCKARNRERKKEIRQDIRMERSIECVVRAAKKTMQHMLQSFTSLYKKDSLQ